MLFLQDATVTLDSDDENAQPSHIVIHWPEASEEIPFSTGHTTPSQPFLPASESKGKFSYGHISITTSVWFILLERGGVWGILCGATSTSILPGFFWWG